MGKINLLSSKIYNRIAAGEVVDRPYSVVKELVENSIDAGAKNIKIEIENGGISSIIITDDGSGIEKNQLSKAILPHATSKISTLSDLDEITSLGFRGEALPSIASVSKLLIESKPKSQELGASIYLEGGEIISKLDCGIADGTCVTVKNLFYNTPARERFLKSARSEEAEISSTVAKFILGNPDIAFKYYVDNQLKYQSFGDGLESAMINVYGVDIIKDCIYVDTDKNGFLINGYIGKQHFTKGNRSHQITFLNGRYISNQTISASISNAYSKYLMKHRYPFYVLNVSMPASTVDINVHPNKLDVRFSNNQIVYSTIYSVVSKALDNSNEAFNISSMSEENKKEKPNEFHSNYATHNTKNDFFSVDEIVFRDSGATTINYQNPQVKEVAVDIFAENKAYLEKLEKEKQNKKTELEVDKEQIAINSGIDLRYIGQALNTFLVFEDGVDLYFADQHAAHERILFDKLINDCKNEKIVSQPMLLPYLLNVNDEEFSFVFDNLQAIQKLGIEIEEFGINSFKISALPVFLSNMNVEGFFGDLLSDISLLKSIAIEDVLRDKIAQKACKSAIKSGDMLDASQIKILTEMLKNNIGLKCPHGRPVVVKITRTEIDKWFKRIV